MLKYFIILFISFTQIGYAGHVKYGIPDHYTWSDPISALSSNGIPLSPIRKGLKELSLTAAYINVGEDDDDYASGVEKPLSDPKSTADGYGINVSWFEALGKNWGYSIILSHTPLHGDVVALAKMDTNDETIEREYRAEIDATSTQALGLVVFDPLYNHESINTPIFIGAGLIQSDQKGSLIQDIDGTLYDWKASTEFLSVGLALGGAIQFNTGDFRWSPFLVAFAGTATPVYEVSVERAGNNDFTNNQESEFEVQYLGGIGLQYTPWGVSAKWTPNFFGHDQSLYTLSKTWTFDDN
ncbi:MAG: hypothetical protein ACO20H_08545 [Bacteriovoracaceae bacterium]